MIISSEDSENEHEGENLPNGVMLRKRGVYNSDRNKKSDEAQRRMASSLEASLS